MKPQIQLLLFGNRADHPLTADWVRRGGVPVGNQKQAMNRLFGAFNFAGAFDWFQLLDGADLASAIIPQIGAGTTTNTGFVPGDFSPTTGLKGSVAGAKRLVIPIAANTRNVASGGWMHGMDEMDRSNFRSGIGWQMTGANCHSVWGTTQILARWGANTESAVWTTGETSGIFIASATASNALTLYHDGVSVATNGNNRTAITATTNCAVFGATDGVGTATQMSDMRGQFFGLLSRGISAAEAEAISAALAAYQAERGRPAL